MKTKFSQLCSSTGGTYSQPTHCYSRTTVTVKTLLRNGLLCSSLPGLPRNSAVWDPWGRVSVLPVWMQPEKEVYARRIPTTSVEPTPTRLVSVPRDGVVSGWLGPPPLGPPCARAGLGLNILGLVILSCGSPTLFPTQSYCCLSGGERWRQWTLSFKKERKK